MNTMQKSGDETQEAVGFRWSFVIFPVAVLAVAVIITAVFFPRLEDTVTTAFKESASGRELSRVALAVLLLGINLFITLVSFGLVKLLLMSSRYWAEDNTSFVLPMIRLLGNMPGLIQLVITVAVLYMMLYNIYETIAIPFWLAALMIMLAGGLFIIAQLAGFLKASRQDKEKPIQEIDKHV